MQVAGREVLAMSGRELADLRGAVVSMIFQEPLLAFDPVYTVGAQIVEASCLIFEHALFIWQAIDSYVKHGFAGRQCRSVG